MSAFWHDPRLIHLSSMSVVSVWRHNCTALAHLIVAFLSDVITLKKERPHDRSPIHAVAVFSAAVQKRAIGTWLKGRYLWRKDTCGQSQQWHCFLSLGMLLLLPSDYFPPHFQFNCSIAAGGRQSLEGSTHSFNSTKASPLDPLEASCDTNIYNSQTVEEAFQCWLRSWHAKTWANDCN